jgi:guanylate kinase
MRLDKAREECGYRDRFDHVIVNDQLTVACQQALVLVQDYLAK